VRGRGQIGGAETGRLGRPDPAEQPELEPEVDHPAPIEAADAGGELLEPIVVDHPADCRMAGTASTDRRRCALDVARQRPGPARDGPATDGPIAVFRWA